MTVEMYAEVGTQLPDMASPGGCYFYSQNNAFPQDLNRYGVEIDVHAELTHSAVAMILPAGSTAPIFRRAKVQIAQDSILIIIEPQKNETFQSQELRSCVVQLTFEVKIN
jgi:hypothetical protein